METITKVELYNGKIKLGEMTVAPYSFTLKDLSDGSYSLKAVATDNLKATTTSSSLDLEVKPLIMKTVNSLICIRIRMTAAFQ